MAIDPSVATGASFREAVETHTLRDAVMRDLRDSRDRERVAAQLEALAIDLRGEGRVRAEDYVLDVLDYVTGWSSPHMQL